VGAQLTVTADRLTPDGLSAFATEWAALAARAQASPYLTFGWLESWASVYGSRLILVRIADEQQLVALALLEQRRFGALHFAGLPVTPLRGLLVGHEREREAWKAFGGWLRGRSKWSVLNALAAGECALPGATIMPVPWLAMSLPSDFETYLIEREPGPRREFRRRLRVAEREGAVTSMLGEDRIRQGIEAFAELHQARARAKGERHHAIDERLVGMLTRVAEHAQPELRAFVLEQHGRSVGVALQLDHARQTCAYNTGFDPAAAKLSPGVIVRLASIRDAIERGGQSFDFGPGDFAYKRALGGAPVRRCRIDTANPEIANRLLGARIRTERRLRRSTKLRRGVQRWRDMRARRAGPG
jgi:CelD/BcsL family acetyltransferase involved in cellulose biosynthesis